MPCLEVVHIDFVATLFLDHLDALPLKFRNQDEIVLTEYPRHRDMIVPRMCQFVSETRG